MVIANTTDRLTTLARSTAQQICLAQMLRGKKTEKQTNKKRQKRLGFFSLFPLKTTALDWISDIHARTVAEVSECNTGSGDSIQM